MEDFNFEKIGKRMPYGTPDGFFPQMQERIVSEAMKAEPQVAQARRRPRLRILSFITAAAAAVALLIVGYTTSRQTVAADYADVERAFDNLNTEDKELMMETYTANAYLYAEDTGL